MSLEEVIEILKESGKEDDKVARNLVQAQLNSISDLGMQVSELELINEGKGDGLKVSVDLHPLHIKLTDSLIKEIGTLDMFPDETVRISSVTVSSYHPNLGEIIKSSKKLNLLRGIVNPTLQFHQALKGKEWNYINFKGDDFINIKDLNGIISYIAALMPGVYLLMPQEEDMAPLEKVGVVVRRVMTEEGLLDEHGTAEIHNIRVAESTPDFASFDVYLTIKDTYRSQKGISTTKRTLKATVNCYLQPTKRVPYEETEIKRIEVILPEEFKTKINWLGGGTYSL